MGDVQPINPRLGSQEATFVRLEHGLAIVRGGDVQTVLTAREVTDMLVAGAALLREVAGRVKVTQSNSGQSV